MLYLTVKNFTGNNPTREADGIEFDSISRSSLLQILSAFEEYVHSQVGKNEKTIFTADFANNKYTRPYVYPKMTKNH